MEFTCFLCNKSFTQKHSLIRHTNKQHGGIFDCPICNREFGRYDNFMLHWKACIHSLEVHEQNENRKRLLSGGESEERPSKRKFEQNVPSASRKRLHSGDEELEGGNATILLKKVLQL